MQFTQSQKDALFRLRRNYLTQLSVIGRQRRQLLQQLRNVSGGVGAGRAQPVPSCFSVDGIIQQLQGLLTQEQTAFLKFLRVAGHEVRARCLLLRMFDSTKVRLKFTVMLCRLSTLQEWHSDFQGCGADLNPLASCSRGCAHTTSVQYRPCGRGECLGLGGRSALCTSLSSCY